MSYTELFNIISRPWASIKEISKIARCGRDTAIRIRNDIESKINSQGKDVPKGKTILVPMRDVLEYLNLDYNYIIEMALNEKKISMNELNRTNVYASISK